MDDPTEPSGNAPPAVRRRVVPTNEPESREGRTGCLIIGAVLGIAIGALFTFFALPPLLNYYFGEQHIGVGGTYEGGGKAIQAQRLAHGIDTPEWGVLVTLDVAGAWNPKLSDFELESETGDRVTATSALLQTGEPLAFNGSQTAGSVMATVGFPDPGGPRPRYLHIKDLNVRFELPRGTP